MMFWFGHDHGGWGWGWGWFAMSFGMVLFWGLVVAAAVLLFRALDRTPDRPYTRAPDRARAQAAPSPEQVLADRFARGEIDEEEYRRRLAVLSDSGHRSGP